MNVLALSAAGLDNEVGLVLAIALVAFLVVALIKPERS